MFVKHFIAILTMVIMCAATTGCSTNTSNLFTSWLPSSSPSTLEAEMAKLPHPFVIRYGVNGTTQMQIFRPTDSSAEKLANLSLIMMEPGFIAMINLDFCKNGMNTKLENLFKREDFHLVGTESYKYAEDKYILKMFFVKNGMDGRVTF